MAERSNRKESYTKKQATFAGRLLVLSKAIAKPSFRQCRNHPRQDVLLQELSGAMGAFFNATVELGVANSVTPFTSSEFGRTLMPNSSGGTDHAWGSQADALRALHRFVRPVALGPPPPTVELT